MSNLIKLPADLVFGLDIGTRSIVGTVGYLEQDTFHAVAMCIKEHESRAMIDGQIHDIMQVGQTILEVKKELEAQIDRKLTEVCIAAAGRVLQTVTTTVEYEYGEETVIDREKIHSLDMLGVEKAHHELHNRNQSDIHFYCVGYSVVKYYLNGSFIMNLEGHKGVKAGAELIATFLPDEVVESLYSAVDFAGLEVANLTLEPIAAINVAIPEKFRMLNIALVDVGAGTSDICLTKDGSIIAYGMIPKAGDELTEVISRQYLVDFQIAEDIKTSVKKYMETAGKKKSGTASKRKTPVKKIKYKDIMGLTHEIEPREVADVLENVLDEITQNIADKIIELNGNKPVSAVFVVGGGGKFPGFTGKLASKLGILEERVALRGEEVLGQVNFYQKIKKDSLLVTPIGICLNYYDKTNNFIYVQVNNERVKLYNNNHLTVVEAAMQAGFPNDGLFPKRGRELNFTVNGKTRIVRGAFGETSVIKVNGITADINTPIDANDRIDISASTAGEPAAMNVEDLPEFSSTIQVKVNGSLVVCPKFVQVNGELVSGFYAIQEKDEILVLNHYTLQQLLEFMDVILPNDTEVSINNKKAALDDLVYDNFAVDWSEQQDSSTEIYEETQQESGGASEDLQQESGGVSGMAQQEAGAAPVQETREFMVVVNKEPVLLRGKKDYIFVDVFDYISFDLQTLQGSRVVTKLNGTEVSYVEPLKAGDVLEIYWEE